MRKTLLAVVIALASHAADTLACSRLSPVDSREMVLQADMILLVTAQDYVRAPANVGAITTGTPDSVIRFLVDERVTGRTSPLELALPGYLREEDDFNDHPVPYNFVRRNGRRGSCFANTYRAGAHYLLILRYWRGTYTTDWYALGPTNEQVRNADDPWVRWVKEVLAVRSN